MKKSTKKPKLDQSIAFMCSEKHMKIIEKIMKKLKITKSEAIRRCVEQYS